MKEWIAGLILPFADTVYNLVNALPMGFVRGLVFGILAALAIWILRMPPQLPEESGGAYSFIKDLRFFAIGVIVLQTLLYIIF